MLFQHPRGVQVPEVDRPADHLHPRCRRLRPSRARPDRRRRQEAVLRSQADEESSSESHFRFPIVPEFQFPLLYDLVFNFLVSSYSESQI